MAAIVISQRPSAIKDADMILVLDNGKPAGMGTHKELLRNCPVYIEICQSQGISSNNARKETENEEA